VAPEYLPTKRGFQHQYGHYNGALDYFTHRRDGGLDWHRDDRALTETGYSTPLIAKEAVRLIRERDKKRPLFLYIPFNAIHGPFQVPPRYKRLYTSHPEPRRSLLGMTAALDEAVGTITSELDQQGMRENTLLIFASDNGGPAPGRVSDNGIYRSGKGTLFEGGVRVAACVSWPGKIKPKSIVDQPLHMVDWFPTLLGRAGAKTPGKLPLDGRDAWATIAENKPSPHDAILLNTTPTGGALLVGQWKLIVGGRGANVDEGSAAGSDDPAADGRVSAAGAARAGRPRVELFNLAVDPSEKTNLADAQPGRVTEMRAKYDALAKQAVPPKSRPKPPDFKVPKIWGEKD
jgi:arylsulfatase A-like enzyme